MQFLSILLVAAFASTVASTRTHQTPKNHLRLHHPGVLPDNNDPASTGLSEQLEGTPALFTIPKEVPELLADSCPSKDLGFCGKENSCCPMKGTCCPMGAGCCAEAGSGCFPGKDGKTRCCNLSAEKLCSSRTCIPKNTICCRNGNYCGAGSYCVKGGCCRAGNICKGKTGGKPSGHDPRGVAPARLREV
ncbi:hypothetical protein HOY80DRAFT_1032114 [Tuber brumale]|nr:hypothetical protein HOY80DRAFT_1032114 [Tuber brumale]